MKSVLLSVQPKWCKLICSGEKTVEVRKNRPNCELPFKCYIYCTKGKPTFTQSAFCDDISNGKVIGEFVCDRIYQYSTTQNCKGVDITDEEMTKASCLTKNEIEDYEFSAEAKENCIYKIGVFGWHITDLVVYDEPRELKEFKRPCPVSDCQECKFALWQTHTFISESKVVGCTQKIKAPQSWCYVWEEGA